MKNDKPPKPGEIPVPGREPEIMPTPEPEPGVWPGKNPEIQPEREPLTTPPSAPPEIPKPSDIAAKAYVSESASFQNSDKGKYHFNRSFLLA